MPRILYDHLLTESGFDLLTEAGDALVLREIGMAGDGAATGGHGSVAGTGRVIALAPPVTPNAGGSYAAVRRIPAPKPLRGTVTAAGQSGSAAGRGHLTLVGKATVSGHTGTVAARGQLTLVGAATLTASPARLSGRGDAFDELALVLALAA